jgi:hypothetical protein
MRKSAILIPVLAAVCVTAGCASGHNSGENAVDVGAAKPSNNPAADLSNYQQPFTGPLTAVTRRTAGPVALRVYAVATGEPLACDPYARQCVPTWCEPTGGVAVELSTEAVAAREMSQRIGVAPGSALSLLQAGAEGTAEGAPLQVAVVATADGVDHVVLKTGGGQDTMTPVKGLAALTVPGADATGSVTAYDASGKVLEALTLPQEPTASQPACAPQPIKLPKPGKQPADPAAAEKQVRQAFQEAFTAKPAGTDPDAGLAFIEDGDTLHDAVAQVRQNFPQASATITVKTGAIVFTDPTTAIVQFTTEYSGGAPYSATNGRAILRDGKWLVSTATYCGLLSWGGATCP